MRRTAWKLLGAFSLLLGLIGIVVPLLPTTVFLLLSAFAFERGSERLHDWLVNHPRLGPPIREWREHGAISARARTSAFLILALVLTASIVFGAPFYVIAIQAVVSSAVIIFIATRPLPPR